jgi:hypothetical protein
MQKFPEDELTKHRRAMMSAETVLDYKKRMDDARAEAAAKNPFMADAEKFAKIYEELKAGTKKFYDMHVLEERGRHEAMQQHLFRSPSMGCCSHPSPCPICEAEKRANLQKLPKSANFQKLPIEYRIGVDMAKKPAKTVLAEFDPTSTELRIAAELSESADKAVRDKVDRTFLDMLEKYLPAGGSLWPPPRPDPVYQIEGIRRSMHDDFVRRMQRELAGDMPLMRVTCSDPMKSKAEVWKAVKDFMDRARKDKTAVPVLPSDIKIEPLTPDVLRDGFALISRERPRDCWDKAREALRRLPGDTPLFYNEVLGEYGGPQIRGNRVDAVYIDEVSGPNKNGDDLTEVYKNDAAFKYWEEMICAGLNVPKEMLTPASDMRTMAQKFYDEGKISKETLLKYAGIEKEVKDEPRSGEAVRQPDAVERPQQRDDNLKAAVERAERGEFPEGGGRDEEV